MAGIPIHNAPQGKTAYADDGSDWPLISGQVQWMNDNAMDMWHTHCEFATKGAEPGFPLWGECGDQDITVPVTIQVRAVPGLTGAVQLVWGEYSNHIQFPVIMDTPGPYVGMLNPDGTAKVTVYTGHAIFNAATAAKADTTGLFPMHGWVGVSLKCRTILDNGDQFDNETNVALFCVADPTIPESALNEAGIPIQGKAINVRPHGLQEASVVGIHLTEIKDQSVPLTAPFDKGTHEVVYGYNYGQDQKAPLQNGVYTATLDQNMHLVPPIMGVVLPTQGFGEGGNYDTLDPVFMNQNPVLPGLKPGTHVLILAWDIAIPPGNWTNQYGQQEPGGWTIRSILKLIVHLGTDLQPAGPLVLASIPTLVGLTQAQAESAIIAAGFRVGNVAQNDAGQYGHPDFPIGVVWTQVPGPGPQQLPTGTLINIGVQQGGAPPVLVAVPNVVGNTLTDASNILTAAGLNGVDAPGQNSPTVPAGSVISQSPDPGVMVPKGTPVTVVPSLGPVPQVTVPNVVGMTQAGATAALTAVGLVLGQVGSAPAGTAGNIVSQQPLAGAVVNTGTSVSIVVSAGTQPATLVGPVQCYKNADGTYMFCAFDGNIHICIDNVPIQTT